VVIPGTNPPRRTKKANAFGLFDMSGNVWEWTEDCWHESYQYVPSDSSAWRESHEGDCNLRVLRGGSWRDEADDLRSAARYYRGDAESRFSIIGFRLAQDSP